MSSASQKPSRNLALDLVRVTEAAALAASPYMGRDDKISADQAAVDGMRMMLNTLDMEAVVVIGEGEKDEAPMLYNGEVVGKAGAVEMDLAVDPIDGTRPLAQGRPNSIATVAISPRGTMFDPGPFVYMDKLAVGPECKGKINIEAPVEENLKAIAKAKNIRMQDVTVVLLHRTRHEQLVADIRKAGARIRFIDDGDVAGALMTSFPDTGVDVLMGVGGTPEGVLAACALKVLGGEIQGKLYARNDEELKRGRDMGYDFDMVITMDDLVSSNDVFFSATGITDGEFVGGVKYMKNTARTDSLILRGLTGTIRRVSAVHQLEKLKKISSVSY
jgi:fructose-1,6-bisphosphatase II